MSGTAAQILAGIAAALDAGKSVTFAVASPPSGSNLVGFHAYTVDRINLGNDGKPVSMRLRNPWGVDAYTSTDGIKWQGFGTHKVQGFGPVVVGPVATHNTTGEYAVTFDEYVIKPLTEEKK